MSGQGEDKQDVLSMAVPNGLIQGLIGVLVLLTPVVAEVPAHQLAMDLIAGGILVVGGTFSLVWGMRRNRARRAGAVDSSS